MKAMVLINSTKDMITRITKGVLVIVVFVQFLCVIRQGGVQACRISPDVKCWWCVIEEWHVYESAGNAWFTHIELGFIRSAYNRCRCSRKRGQEPRIA